LLGIGLVLRSLGGALSLKRFLIARQSIPDQAHPTLSNAEPRFAVEIAPCQLGLLLSFCCLTAIFMRF
jgi:hypothetical protein